LAGTDELDKRIWVDSSVGDGVGCMMKICWVLAGWKLVLIKMYQGMIVYNKSLISVGSVINSDCNDFIHNGWLLSCFFITLT